MVLLVGLNASRYCPGVPGPFTIEDARRLLADARTAAVLEPAREAALGAVRRAVEAGEMAEAVAADYAASINSFRDAWALDEWLFWQPPLLNRRICNYPLCFDAPRPNVERRAGGNPPLYCSGVNERAQPHAVSQNAVRRREKLREAATSQEGVVVVVPGTLPVASGPVTEARATFTTGVDLVVRGMEELTRAVRDLTDTASRGTDDALVQAEIEAVRHKANEDVEREAALKNAFEQRAIAAENNAAKSAAELAQLSDAYREIEEQAERDAAARKVLVLAVLLALTATRASAARTLAQARRDAEAELSTAKAEFDETLGRREEEAAAKIAAADEAAASALSQAEEREAQAALTVAAATQRVEDMAANVATEKARAEGLAADNSALRDAAVEREQTFQQALSKLASDHQQVLDQLRSKNTALRDRLDEVRAEHEATIGALHERHRDDITTRLKEAAAAAEKLKTAELTALQAQISSLTTQLQSRNDELRRLHMRDAGTEGKAPTD